MISTQVVVTYARHFMDFYLDGIYCIVSLKIPSTNNALQQRRYRSIPQVATLRIATSEGRDVKHRKCKVHPS